MVLTAYYLLLSQPCRSLVMFLKLNNIEFASKITDPTKGDTKTPEYLALNPNHTVPMIDDDGFVIWESIAAVKYLAAKYKTPDHWYPSDIKKRAKVDMMCDWHHLNIRKYVVGVFLNVVVLPWYGLPAISAEEAVVKYKELEDNLELMEKHILGNQKYLCGDEVTIADIFCANELVQMTVLKEDIYTNHAVLQAYLDRVRDRLNPVWDDVATDLMNLKGKL